VTNDVGRLLDYIFDIGNGFITLKLEVIITFANLSFAMSGAIVAIAVMCFFNTR